MRHVLFAVAAVVAVASYTACHHCTPGPFDEPNHCTAQGDAGSSDCTPAQSCVPILGGQQSDTRCFSPCSAGSCGSGYSCQPYGIGTGCGKVCEGAACGVEDAGDDPDAGGGTGPQCVTRFLCVPTYCN